MTTHYVTKISKRTTNNWLPPKISQDDIMLWADGGWCYRFEFEEYSQYRSDDYEVINDGSSRWNHIINVWENA